MTVLIPNGAPVILTLHPHCERSLWDVANMTGVGQRPVCRVNRQVKAGSNHYNPTRNCNCV